MFRVKKKDVLNDIEKYNVQMNRFAHELKYLVDSDLRCRYIIQVISKNYVSIRDSTMHLIGYFEGQDAIDIVYGLSMVPQSFSCFY